jgi:SAM-dependent methyltransferase
MQSHFNIAGARFPLVEEVISLAGISVPLVTVPYSAEELERIVQVRGLKEREWPYWLEDWPATYALAEVLDAEIPGSWPGPVLDLGCGSGVLAAFMRLRFGIEPFCCDFNPDACRMAVLNARRPGERPQGRVFCADFRAFPARPAFGLVLAGEMLYARENQAPILEFLSRHLAPGGAALLADKGRSAAEGFAEAAAAAGFRVETRMVRIRGSGRNAHVYRLERD